MSDDFPAELERAYRRIEELEAEATQMERNLKNYMNIAWWRTYNAALAGYCARAQSYDLQGPEHIHEASVNAAKLAHGALP
jgi:hypothetical protein